MRPPPVDAYAVITGADSRLGQVVARTFARDGMALFLLGTSTPGVSRVAQRVREGGGEVLDAGETSSLGAELQEALFCQGAAAPKVVVNVCVHEDASTSQPLGSAVESMLTPVVTLTRAALVSMQQKRMGAIVNVVSTAALRAGAYAGAANVAEPAILGLTRAIAVEYAQDGIRSNAVCHAPLRTDQHGAADGAAPTHGRRPSPEEVATVISFLASDRASYLTGAVLVADGGISSHTGLPSLFGAGPEW